MTEDKYIKKGANEYALNGKLYTLRNLPKNIRYTDRMLDLLEKGLLEVEGYCDCYTINDYAIPLGHNLYWNLAPTAQMLSPNGEWISIFSSKYGGKKPPKDLIEDKDTSEAKKVLLVLADENFIFEQAYRKFIEPLKFDAEDIKAFFGERLVDYCSDRATKAKASKIDAEVRRLIEEWHVDETEARALLEKKSLLSNSDKTLKVASNKTETDTGKVA